ncbi:hypothetical protein VC83_04064 [Pseudogymnoascus destructans]|uniref:Uncharacterized protein n=1 Tax=Pseudogymnoascus destructans TaxID=655981 RepID=A0A177AD89_9PEZI|nr:uncharacterized protein VC83_04064 [Pseudogymnoascus destructans]OAF59770.1 hypothetical protein VC83_04064 [Pseudogymnoascus destructans]
MQQFCSGGQRPKPPVLSHKRELDVLCRRVFVRTSSPLWHLCAVFASKGKVTMDRDEYNVNDRIGQPPLGTHGLYAATTRQPMLQITNLTVARSTPHQTIELTIRKHETRRRHPAEAMAALQYFAVQAHLKSITCFAR